MLRVEAARRRAEQTGDDIIPVTEAVGPLLGADLTALHTFPGDGTATTLAGWNGSGSTLPTGTRLPLDGDSVAARIFRTGAPARMDIDVEAAGETADVPPGPRLRSTVGAPILVEGDSGARWRPPLGARTRSGRTSRRVPRPSPSWWRPRSPTRRPVRRFARLVDEQQALQRVATLVAEGVRTSEIFSAACDEIARLVGSAGGVLKFEHDGPAIIVVGHSNASSRAVSGAYCRRPDLDDQPPVPNVWSRS
jgi:hypothetical protein